MIHTELDHTEIVPGLHIGSRPPAGFAVANAGFHTLILCEPGWQERKGRIFEDVRAFNCPFEDDPNIRQVIAFHIVKHIAFQIAGYRKMGWKTLVCCKAGINRSAFMAAWSLLVEYKFEPAGSVRRTPQEAIALVREKRGAHFGGRVDVLNNVVFVRELEAFK
jgi:protein-tyrosine phosphatase